MTPIERYLANLKTNEETGCMEWQCFKGRGGYGYMKLNGKTRRTHRVAYEMFVGIIPDGMFVCHHCDNPSCCNPEHLFVGTHTDNMRDKVRKGRQGNCGVKQGQYAGTKHPQAKLTDKDIIEIRASNESSSIIAPRYNVSPRTIRAVRCKAAQ